MDVQVQELAESSRFDALEAQADGSGTLLVRLIDEGQGSSGFYPAATLEQAARDRVYPAGTHMYLDHPSVTESMDRPERSVKDLAAVLREDARFDPTTKALVAKARVFAPYREVLSEMADSIGVSIRAVAEGKMDKVDGKQTLVVTRLTEGLSVDFVTRAGRGGKILEVLESARVAATEALPGGLTANDLRRRLNSAVQSAYTTEGESYAYVMDWTDTDVVYSVETATAATLYLQDYTASEAGEIALSQDRTEVRATTVYVPVNPAGLTTTESKEDPMPQIEESRLRDLEEAASRATALEAERDQANAKANAAEAALAAYRTNRPVVATVVGESASIPTALQPDIVESVLAALPVDADESAVKAAALAAREAKEREAAIYAEALGAGSVRALGGGTQPPTSNTAVTEADVDQAVARAFGRITKEA